MVEVTAGGDQITEVKDDLVKDVTQNIENIKLEEVLIFFLYISLFKTFIFRNQNRTKRRSQRNRKFE